MTGGGNDIPLVSLKSPNCAKTSFSFRGVNGYSGLIDIGDKTRQLVVDGDFVQSDQGALRFDIVDDGVYDSLRINGMQTFKDGLTLNLALTRLSIQIKPGTYSLLTRLLLVRKSR